MQVSRLLKDARDQKVLREVFRFPADLSPEDRLEIVNSFFDRHGQLEQALSDRSRRLSRVQSGGGSPFKFIPIAGEPTNHEPNGVAPSDAARRLSLAWPDSTSLSLRGVPARIPKSVYDQDGARELIRYSNHYQRIFGASDPDETPLIAEVPMILTGLGNVGTSERDIAGVSDPWYTETVEAEGPDVLDLAVGNIGGVWIAKNEISNEDKERVAKVNERWLGAQYGDFRGCALNADLQQRSPGVVVVAVEPDKADIVLEALHLINVLIVSRQLADELADRLLKG